MFLQPLDPDEVRARTPQRVALATIASMTLIAVGSLAYGFAGASGTTGAGKPHDRADVGESSPSGSFRQNEPAGMTQLLDWDFCNVYAAQLDGTGGSSSVVGLSPTVSVEDWNKGEPLGPTGFGLDSFNVAGMASSPCVHVRPYPDGLPSGQGASTYQWSLGASRSTVYWSGVFRFRDDGDGFEHNTAMKMLYFLGGTNFWFGKNGNYFAIEQISHPVSGDVLYPTSDSVTVASLDGTFFEAEGCVHAGSGDGQFFLWINGVQQAAYTTLTFSGPSNMQWAGTYGGGTPSTKTGTEYADIDDLYVSYGTGACN